MIDGMRYNLFGRWSVLLLFRSAVLAALTAPAIIIQVICCVCISAFFCVAWPLALAYRLRLPHSQLPELELRLYEPDSAALLGPSLARFPARALS